MLDYHVHTRYCRHASGEVIEYVRAAIGKGLREIGISDHYPMIFLPKLSYDDYSMDLEELPLYMQDIKNSKEMFNSNINVKLGIEVDYYHEKESIIRNINFDEFDYLIGVIHVIDDWVIDDPRNILKYEEYDLEIFYSNYFTEVEKLIRSDLFDIIGHIDVIKKFNHIPRNGIEEYIMPCFELIAKKELCVEINTSGIDRAVKDTYPGQTFFSKMYEMGIQVTLGSDAHKPSEIGRYFDNILKTLKKAGYSRIVSFKNREKDFIKI